MRAFPRLLPLLILAMLAACRSTAPSAGGSTPSPAPPGSGGPHDLVGGASWYGPGFEGRATASGEIFTGRDATAAHRTLPFDTTVRVTVTSGEFAGRSTEVRINDRGPFVSGRVIDLSRAAAADIGLDRAGVLPVELSVLSWGAGLRRPEREDPDRPWRVQVGTFASYENARLLRERLAPAAAAPVTIRERAGLYRVFVGPFPNRKVAASAKRRLEEQEIDGILVADDEPAS